MFSKASLQTSWHLSEPLLSAGVWQLPLGGNLVAQCNLQLRANYSWCKPMTEITGGLAHEHKGISPSPLEDLLPRGFCCAGGCVSLLCQLCALPAGAGLLLTSSPQLQMMNILGEMKGYVVVNGIKRPLNG